MKIIIERDKTDKCIYHLYYKSKSGRIIYICPIFEDVIYEIAGVTDYEAIRSSGEYVMCDLEIRVNR